MYTRPPPPRASRRAASCREWPSLSSLCEGCPHGLKIQRRSVLWRCFLFVTTVNFAVTPSAMAQHSPCCSATPPVFPLVNPDVPDEGSCGGICNPVSNGDGTWYMKCDLNNRGGGAQAAAVAVRDPPGAPDLCKDITGSAAEYCAWGQDTSETAFYCAWNPTNAGEYLTEVQVFDGPNDDRIFFWYDALPVEYNLEPYAGFSEAMFVGRQIGQSGDDEIQGSRSTASTYQDKLHGGADADKVCGLNGDDIGDGNSGDDLVCGDEDNDVLSGGGDDDAICGYDGYNVLSGDGGNDALDKGASGTNDGGLGNDKCDLVTDPNCEALLLGSECPT